MSLTDHLARVLKEASLIVVIGCCVFMCIAIWSYNPQDPGWSHAGYQPHVSNWAGATGAWISDILFSFVGAAAYIVPILILWPAIRFMWRRYVGIVDAVPFFMLRTTGAIFLLLPISVLSSIHVSNQELGYPFTAGGLVGLALSDLAVSLVSVPGATVVALTVMFFGLTLFMETSWQKLLERIGSIPFKAVGVLVGLAQIRIPVPKLSVPKPKVQPTPVKDPTAKTFKTATESMSARKREEPALDQVPDLDLTSFSKSDINITLEEDGTTMTSNAGNRDFHITLEEEPVAVTEPVKWAESRPLVAEEIVPSPAPEASEAKVVPFTARRMVEDTLTAAKKHLKIVPLSETHTPIANTDLDLEEAGKISQAARETSMTLPSVEALLDPPEKKSEQGYTEEQLEHMSRLLEEKLKDFSVIAEVVEVNPGPVITRFEIQPAPGVKASKISNLARDLARSMAVSSVRVVEVIPGKSVVGIEIPNESRQIVHLSEVLSSSLFSEAKSKLTLALGNDIAGNPVVTNLAKMPHLLVAGTTGSGKSVGVNAMLLSLLFKATPKEVRLILVDPKMLELSIYEGIPHLLTPVITDMKEAAGGLRWCVGEMERRYKLMAKMGVRNLAGFNDKVLQAEEEGVPLRDPLWNASDYGLPADEPAPCLETLPYIVVVIDEFADMMMMVGKKVEELIARIAQKARAAGIHLILATQRPSVDVITGLIKANVPTRIAFQVSSKIDSRTILDQSGAENLLGHGDMLYLPAGTSIPNRVHGAFVSDDEVHRTVEAWKRLGPPNYLDEIVSEGSEEGSFSAGSGGMFDDEQDALYDEAVAFVTESRKASISAVQRRLKIGYNRAARMIETMEAAGVVTSAGSNGQREVIAPPPPRD
ncbi:DNA translocase FtsK [Nitrincola tibetensis]|uniref:DNA translocase FtsK n=1 Tax=Nitrincola tibetensis TaxID=2219697 RepID=A0A364NR35_9GAMM|nr:DNA translocase FtsK [Nitrincola tibetensis]RAU19337.1 DNA translocase FtsK [Nitrincola tibetensis]